MNLHFKKPQNIPLFSTAANYKLEQLSKELKLATKVQQFSPQTPLILAESKEKMLLLFSS
jgi:hypothetical protein